MPCSCWGRNRVSRLAENDQSGCRKPPEKSAMPAFPTGMAIHAAALNGRNASSRRRYRWQFLLSDSRIHTHSRSKQGSRSRDKDIRSHRDIHSHIRNSRGRTRDRNRIRHTRNRRTRNRDNRHNIHRDNRHSSRRDNLRRNSRERRRHIRRPHNYVRRCPSCVHRPRNHPRHGRPHVVQNKWWPLPERVKQSTYA